MRRQSFCSAIHLMLLTMILGSGIAFAGDTVDERPATLQPPSRTAIDAFTSQESVGLRRPANNLRERIDLPFGLNYNRDAKSLLMPLDDKNEWGVGVNAQVVGIAYNPKKLPAPKGWKDLFTDPWVSRLGLTGFQTTFGTVSLIEIAKVFGGSETNVDPALVELKKVLPKTGMLA